MKFKILVQISILALMPIFVYADNKNWQKLESEANQGNADAQEKLALRYINGDDTPKNLVKAYDLLKKSAEQGNAYGKIGLGKLYLYGQGVKQDFSASRKCFKEAFDILNSQITENKGEVYYSLAQLYLNGNGVKQDDTKAEQWFRKAAERYREETNNKNDDSMMHLGNMYLKGLGVKQDTQKALYYFEIAAQNGNVLAQIKLSSLYMDLEQYQSAMNWLLRAEKQNSTYAQYLIGTLYGYGLGVEKNEELMISWITKSAENGNERAQIELGRIYSEGLFGTEKSMLQARKYYSLASKQNNLEAKELLDQLE